MKLCRLVRMRLFLLPFSPLLILPNMARTMLSCVGRQSFCEVFAPCQVFKDWLENRFFHFVCLIYVNRWLVCSTRPSREDRKVPSYD